MLKNTDTSTLEEAVKRFEELVKIKKKTKKEQKEADKLMSLIWDEWFKEKSYENH